MISVCMATYNGAQFIKRQIDSILPQLSESDELIISDDGSSDGTLDIIASYNDKRIKVLHHQKNPDFAKIKYSRNFYYVTENFENALKIANGDYIFLSDQDDVWKENRVKRVLAELCNSDCVMCNYDVIDSNDKIIYESFFEKNPINPRLINNIIASRFIGCCMAFNRTVLQYTLPFPQKLLAHDFWIGCLANKKFKFSFIDEPLHLYRRTGDNVSPSVTGSKNPLLYRFIYRLFFLLQICNRLYHKNRSFWNTKMKILHIITNTELGGAQKVCIDLCRSAVADGNSVAVASMDGGYLWSQLPSEVLQFKLKHMVKPIKPKKDLRVFFELKAVVKRFKPDIIHLHSSKAGVLGRLVAFPHCKRVVYTVHGFDSIRLKYRIFLPLEKILQHFCGAIVGVSDYDNKNLHSEKIKKNVSTVYNGIDEKSVQLAPSFPVKTEKKIVMTIARISPQKKIQMFLDVAGFLPEYQFVWFGGSPEHSADELPQVYKIPENVVLLGDVPNASSYIHFCDLFVLFSNFEGLPMTIIEAMSQKKAIVASNVGGIYELVDDSNGCLIENDVDSACNAIKKILEDSELRKTMEEKSYEKFENNFTLEKMWAGYKEIYRNLCKNGEKIK